MLCLPLKGLRTMCGVSGLRPSSLRALGDGLSISQSCDSIPIGGARSSSSSSERILNMNDLQGFPNKTRRRWGRGPGSGRGKTSGWGHQKSRSTPRAFEGGQTPLYKRLPKIGFFNPGGMDFQVVNVDTIQQYLDMGRLRPVKGHMITIRNLIESGIISRAKGGVKLLAKGESQLSEPLHLEVNNASDGAIKAIEKAGGTVTCVHLNKLALRSMIKPIKFDILPRRARPPPRLMDLYLDGTKCGYLSPEVQIRNMKLFGYVTSEDWLNEEHKKFMVLKRKLLSYKDEEEATTTATTDNVM
jgi:large subunit ribosomal protein L15